MQPACSKVQRNISRLRSETRRGRAVYTVQYATPNGTAATESRESSGTSLELSYMPIRNVDLVFSVDQLDNKITAIGSEPADFFAARESFYRKWFQAGIITTGTSTAAQDFAANVAAEYTAGAAFVGTSNRGVYEYTSTLVGRYKILGGALKGPAVGANLRWESGKILGYAEIASDFNFGGLNNYPGRVSDVTNTHVDESIIAGGMFVSYSRRIFSERVRWRVQFNAQNIFNNERDLRVIAANADGSPVWGMAQPKIFELSNSFEF